MWLINNEFAYLAFFDLPDLIIPALCQAISSMDFPSSEVWSIPSELIPQTTGFSTMLVVS